MSNTDDVQPEWDAFFGMAELIQELGQPLVNSEDDVDDQITLSQLHQKYQEMVIAKRVAERRFETLRAWLAFRDQYQQNGRS